MNRAEVLQGIRRMKFKEIYERHQAKRLSVEEAAEILGLCERSFRRWCQRFAEEGEEGLIDQRLGKKAHNAAPVDEVMALVNLFETRYTGFSVAHFYDKWREAHEGKRSYTWVKTQLHKNGHVKKAKKRGAHRRKRPRRPLPGMMLHQDGSEHMWVEGQIWDLIVTLDDANSEIYSAFFVEEEGTFSSYQGVQEVIEQHGLFCSLYTDRGPHYWYTAEAGGKVDKERLTQFGRAMQQLGIEMIPAYSPEARGRSERMFKTLQARLPKELKLAGITDMFEANQFLKTIFLPMFNRRFTVKAEETGSAFVPWLPTSRIELDDILSIQESRIVAKNNTISYQNKLLQIPQNKHRCHYNKVQVRVHEYIDSSLAIFHGPRCLGRYDKEGRLLSELKKLIQSVA